MSYAIHTETFELYLKKEYKAIESLNYVIENVSFIIIINGHYL